VEVDDAPADHDAAGARLEGRDVGLGVRDAGRPGRVDGLVQRRVDLLGGEAVPDYCFGRRRGLPRSGGEEELDRGLLGRHGDGWVILRIVLLVWVENASCTK
jgi:hypothetical protein